MQQERRGGLGEHRRAAPSRWRPGVGPLGSQLGLRELATAAIVAASSKVVRADIAGAPNIKASPAHHSRSGPTWNLEVHWDPYRLVRLHHQLDRRAQRFQLEVTPFLPQAGSTHELTLVDFFKEGGPFMYVQLFLFAIALPLMLVSLIVRKRGLSLAVIVLAVAILAVGAAGMMRGRHATETAVGNVPAEMVERLRDRGYAEANRNIQLGGLLALVTTAVGGLSFALASRTPPGP